MKRNFVFALSICLCGLSLVAQPRSASEPQKLIETSVGLMAPVWSPDGSKIAVTTDNYTGILVANADGSNLKTITNESGAGYKMKWSADGTQILGRTNIVENNRVLHEVKAWNIVTCEAETFLKKSRKLEGTPTWKSIHSTPALTSSNVYEIMVNNPAKATSQIASLKDYAGKMIINPAISPDGNKVAFQIPGHGMWICNSDGSNLKSLGKGSNPQWLSDNESLIYTVVTDNGTNFTASDIYSININSNSKYLLTGNTSLIPLTPSVSPDGKKVIFENAIDASININNLKY